MQIRQIDKHHFKFGNLYGLKTLIGKEVMRFLTVYTQTIVAPMVTTLLFYVVFALAFGGLERKIGDVPFLEFLAPGLIMMSMVQNAFVNSSSSLMISKIQGNIVDILLPPLSSLELYAGHIIGSVTRGFIVGFVTWIAMELFIHVPIHNVGIVLLFTILGTTMLGNIGIIAGIWSDKFDHIAAVTNFVVTPLAFLSGTFYSIRSLPEVWQFIAEFNPFYYMIDGFRTGFIGVGDTNIFLGAGILIAINLLLALLVLSMLRSGYKIKA